MRTAAPFAGPVGMLQPRRGNFFGDPMASVFVPQANPRASYHAHKQAIDEAIARVLASGSYILGEEAKNFEHEDGLALVAP